MRNDNDISKEINNYLFDFLVTKEGNRDGYTDKQYEDTKRAWKIYISILKVVELTFLSIICNKTSFQIVQ